MKGYCRRAEVRPISETPHLAGPLISLDWGEGGKNFNLGQQSRPWQGLLRAVPSSWDRARTLERLASDR